MRLDRVVRVDVEEIVVRLLAGANNRPVPESGKAVGFHNWSREESRFKTW
jgi:hypothetical protein